MSKPFKKGYDPRRDTTGGREGVPSIGRMWKAFVAMHKDEDAAMQDLWAVAKKQPTVMAALIKKMFPDTVEGSFEIGGYKFV